MVQIAVGFSIRGWERRRITKVHSVSTPQLGAERRAVKPEALYYYSNGRTKERLVDAIVFLTMRTNGLKFPGTDAVALAVLIIIVGIDDIGSCEDTRIQSKYKNLTRYQALAEMSFQMLAMNKISKSQCIKGQQRTCKCSHRLAMDTKIKPHSSVYSAARSPSIALKTLLWQFLQFDWITRKAFVQMAIPLSLVRV